MAADQFGYLKPPQNGGAKPGALRGTTAPAPDLRQVSVRWPGASSDSRVSPPIRLFIVEPEKPTPEEPGRPVEQGSDLEPTHKRGTSESLPAALIEVADEARIRLAVGADPARSEPSVDERSDEPGARFVPRNPPTGSVLGQIGKITEPPQAAPLSVGNKARIPVDLPKHFGRYRIIERLGKGAMGAIYLALDTQLDRQVAVKVPHLRVEEVDAAPNQCDLDRFYREAKAAATLDHPNLCPVYDVGQIDGIPYLTMAYIKGQPLSTHIRRDQPMSQRRVAVMVRKLAQALEEAHFIGVVHRDIKPSNIMVKARGELIIMDFGLVWRIGAQNERLTRIGLVVGTPTYMSPEQASGDVETIGPGCDIYSLGVTMYELLTGRVPFDGPEALVLGQILFVEPPPPSTYRPDLDPRLEAICLKAIAKRLDRRYSTMGEFAMALGTYLRSAKGGAPRSIDVRWPGIGGGVASEALAEIAKEAAGEPSLQTVAPAEAQPVGEEQPVEVLESGALWRVWRRWTAIVEYFARRQAPAEVNLSNYGALHKSLVAQCRARAAKAQGPRREFYLRLARFVLPWMTLTALESTDRELLYSMLSYCQEFEQDLLDPTELRPEPEEVPEPRSRWWLAIGLLVGSFVVALICIFWAI